MWLTGPAVPAASLAGGAFAPAAADLPIIETVGVTKHFATGHGGPGGRRATLKAVDGISLAINRGRDARAGRGDRVRQDHVRAPDTRPVPADVR